MKNLFAAAGADLALNLFTVTMKLLAAWIVISAVLQFVENSFVRNTFTLTIWAVAALSIFGILDQAAETLDSVALSFGDFRLSILAVLKGVFAIFLLLYLALFVSSFAERRVFRSSSFSRSMQVLLANKESLAETGRDSVAKT